MDYILLGMIIENATDTSVSSQLATRLLEPLNLEHTYLYPEQMYSTEMMAHMRLDSTGSGDPVDIMEGSGDLPLAGLFSSLWTSGAIHATAEDLALFVKNLFEGRVITQSALAQMVAPGPELSPDAHYGYGVVVDQVAGKPAYWHSGGAGYSSVYFYFPEERLTIVVLSNLMADLRPIAIGLHDAYTEQQ